MYTKCNSRPFISSASISQPNLLFDDNRNVPQSPDPSPQRSSERLRNRNRDRAHHFRLKENHTTRTARERATRAAASGVLEREHDGKGRQFVDEDGSEEVFSSSSTMTTPTTTTIRHSARLVARGKRKRAEDPHHALVIAALLQSPMKRRKRGGLARRSSKPNARRVSPAAIRPVKASSSFRSQEHVFVVQVPQQRFPFVASSNCHLHPVTVEIGVDESDVSPTDVTSTHSTQDEKLILPTSPVRKHASEGVILTRSRAQQRQQELSTSASQASSSSLIPVSSSSVVQRPSPSPSPMSVSVFVPLPISRSIPALVQPEILPRLPSNPHTHTQAHSPSQHIRPPTPTHTPAPGPGPAPKHPHPHPHPPRKTSSRRATMIASSSQIPETASFTRLSSTIGTPVRTSMRLSARASLSRPTSSDVAATPTRTPTPHRASTLRSPTDVNPSPGEDDVDTESGLLHRSVPQLPPALTVGPTSIETEMHMEVTIGSVASTSTQPFSSPAIASPTPTPTPLATSPATPPQVPFRHRYSPIYPSLLRHCVTADSDATEVDNGALALLEADAPMLLSPPYPTIPSTQTSSSSPTPTPTTPTRTPYNLSLNPSRPPSPRIQVPESERKREVPLWMWATKMRVREACDTYGVHAVRAHILGECETMAGGSGGFANSSGSGSGTGFGVFGARYEWAGEWEQEQEQGGGDRFVQVVTPETFVLDNLGCESDSESDGDEEEDVEDVGDLDWNDVRMDADADTGVPEEMPLEAETHSYDTKTQVGMEIVLEESDPYPPAILTQISPSPSPSSSSSHIHTPHFGRQIQRIDIPPLRTFPIPQYEFCHPIKGRGTPGRGRAWEEWMRVAVMSPRVGMEIDGPGLLNERILDASGNTPVHSRGSPAQESGPVPALATAPAPQQPDGPGSIHGMDVPGPYEDAAKFEAFVAQINARGYTPPPHPYAHSHPESNHLTRSPSDIYHHHVQNSNHIHDAPRKMTTGAGPTLAIAALIPSIPSTTLQHALGFASHLGSPLHDAQGRGVPSSTVTADAGFDRGDAITVDVHVLNDLNTTQFGGALEEGEGSYVLPDTPNKPGSPSNPPSVLQFDLPATEVLLSSATELMEIAHDIQV